MLEENGFAIVETINTRRYTKETDKGPIELTHIKASFEEPDVRKWEHWKAEHAGDDEEVSASNKEGLFARMKMRGWL